MALVSASSSAVSCKHSLLSCYSMGQFLTNLAFFQPMVYKSLAGSNKIYYVAEDGTNPAFWLATRVGKMGPFCPLGIFRAGPARKISLFVFFCHPLLTKLVRSRWPKFGLVLFFFRFFFKQTWSTEHISERTRCLSSARFRVACFNVKCISYNCSFYFDGKPEKPQLCNLQTRLRRKSGAPKENVVENHLNIALLNVF